MKRLAFVLAAFLSLPASATTWYASPGGTGSFCTIATPCSLATAIGQVQTSHTCGNTASMANGTYNNVNITIDWPVCTSSTRNILTATNPMTPGNMTPTVILNGVASGSTTSQIFTLHSGTFFTLNGFKFVSSFNGATNSDIGVISITGATNVNFTNLIGETKLGARLIQVDIGGLDGDLFDNVDLSYPPGWPGGWPGQGGSGDVAGIVGSGSRFTIQNSYFHNLWTAVVTSGSNFTIQDSRFHNVLDHILQFNAGTSNFTVQRNIEYYDLYDAAGGWLDCFGCTHGLIRNNTVYHSGFLMGFNNIMSSSQSDRDIVSFNNIYSSGASNESVGCIRMVDTSCTAGQRCFTDSYNDYYQCAGGSGIVARWNGDRTMAQWQNAGTSGTGFAQCTNCTTANPNFVNAAAADFRLQSGSPAIDAGNSSSTCAGMGDASGAGCCANTIQGAGCDMGAIEGGTPAAGIACTESAYESALSTAAPNVTITFNCAAGTVIPLRGSRFAFRQLTAAGVTVNGAGTSGTGGVILRMTSDAGAVGWWNAITTLCGGGDCDAGQGGGTANDDIPDACPSTGDSNTNMWAIRLQGANDVLKNIRIEDFMEGVRLEANGAMWDTGSCDLPGDDCYSNPGSYNVTIKNVISRNACDKNVQLYGDEALGLSTYDVTLQNDIIESSNDSLRISCINGLNLCGGKLGRYLFDGLTVRKGTPLPFIGDLGQGGVYIGEDGSTETLAVHIKNSTFKESKRGFRFVSGHLVSEGGNTFANNIIRGVVVSGTAKALFRGDTFTSNGGGLSADAGTPAVSGEGGISVINTAVVDAGGGSQTLDGSVLSSPGGNVFSGNINNVSAKADFQNLTGVTMLAKSNCWTDPDPVASGDFIGSVTTSPVVCGSPCVFNCGDGVNCTTASPTPEVCDDGNTVTEVACAYGTLTCVKCSGNCLTVLNLVGPYCGDALINGGGEICDLTNLGGVRCENLGFPGGGTLTCAGSCLSYNTSGCSTGVLPKSLNAATLAGGTVK